MNRIRMKEQTYLLPTEPPSTITVIHPQIKIEKRWCYLKDEGTRTGLAEAKDAVDGYEQGLSALRKLEAKESEPNEQA